MELALPLCVSRHMKSNIRRPFQHLLAATLTINFALWGADLAYRQWAVPIRQHAREAQLRNDLWAMRRMIDQYTADEQRAPQSLEALVDAGYLVEVPKDPMTGSSATWEIILEENPIALCGERGVVDVKSGSRDIDSSGEQRYADW